MGKNDKFTGSVRATKLRIAKLYGDKAKPYHELADEVKRVTNQWRRLWLFWHTKNNSGPKVKEYMEYNELFVWFVFIGLALILLEIVLANTRFIKIP